MGRSLNWVPSDFIGFAIIPGWRPSEKQSNIEEDFIPPQEQAKKAKAFFATLNIQIEALNKEGKPLPEFKDPKELKSPRLHYAIEQLRNLKKDEKTYKESEESGIANILSLLRIDNASISFKNYAEQTALHLLVLHGTLDLVNHLFAEYNLLSEPKYQKEKEQDLINAKDMQGRTALHMATFRSQEDIAQLLLKKGADPHIFDNDEKVPLHYAAEKYRTWIKLLYEATDSSNNPFRNRLEHSKIWKIGLKHYDTKESTIEKSTISDASIWDLNPRYCLLSKNIIAQYENLFADNITTFLEKAQNKEPLRYTIVALPPLLNRMLETHHGRSALSAFLSQDEAGKLACLALYNESFINMLLSEDKLSQLIELSGTYKIFALQILKQHIDKLNSEQKEIYIEALYKHYKTTECTFASVYKTVASELALSEIQTLVGGSQWNIIGRHDFKELAKKAATHFIQIFTGEKDTPIHIAAKRGTLEFIQEILAIDYTQKWCNTLNQKKQSPLDIATTTDTPNTDIIQLLYNKTTDQKILKSYLPKYLQSSVIERKEETIKACIESYPYQLTHALINSKCREKHLILKKIIDSNPVDMQNKLLDEFGKDPLLMLVGINSPISEKYIKATLTNANQLQKLINLPGKHTKSIGLANAEQLAFSIFKQGLDYQKTIEEKKIFLHTALHTWGALFPQIALYVFEKRQQNLLTENDLKIISELYIPSNRLSILEMECVNSNQNLLQKYKEELPDILTKYITHNENQISVNSTSYQILNAAEDSKNNYITHSDENGNTILHKMMMVADRIDGGLSILKPHSQQNNDKDIDNFKSLLKMVQSYSDAFISKVKPFPYKNFEKDTFLHVAAQRDDKALCIVEVCFKDKKLQSTLRKLCDTKNPHKNTPLETALKAKNVSAIALLEQHTDSIEVWKSMFIDSPDTTDIDILKKHASEELFLLKREYRLLNYNYRNTFKECIKAITSSNAWKKNIETLKIIIKQSRYTRYVIIDSPHLFEYLFAYTDPRLITYLLCKHNRDTTIDEKILLETLEDKRFDELLQRSTSCDQIVQDLGKEYSIDKKDGAMTLKRLQQGLKEKLSQRLQSEKDANSNDTEPKLNDQNYRLRR